jgi:ribosomal protein S18 acetylase RimI-like enzyme
MNKSKKIGITVIFAALLCGLFGYYCIHEKGPIYEFNTTRDTSAILDLFDKNWHWLIANEGSSPAFYLKYRTPNENPAYFGKLKLKVLREKNEFMGFVAYYMEQPRKGQLLFLAVDKKFRGKGYGTILAEYAMQDMTNNLGAEKIGLWTRLSNPAQRIYKKLGFVESYYTEGGYIYFEYYPSK